MNRRIKFRHLEAFVGITRAQSLKAAAGALNLTQPAISKTLKDLEDILQVSLMVRGRGGVFLTREGEVFLQFAEQSLAALQHGLTSLNTLDDGAARVLNIGALPSVAAKLLPAAVSRFRSRSPDTVVQIEDGPHGVLVDKLRSGRLDLVIGRLGQPDTMAGLSFTQLYSERVVIVVAADHPLAGTGALGAIGDWTVLYPPRGSAIRPLVDRLLIANGVVLPEDRIETVSGAFGRALTLGPDRAVWIISHGVVADDVAAGRMVPLAINTDITAGPVGIMARSEEEPNPVVRRFRQSLVSLEGDLG